MNTIIDGVNFEICFPLHQLHSGWYETDLICFLST